MSWYAFTAYKLGRGWNFSSKYGRVTIIFMVIGAFVASLALGSSYWQHVTSEFGSAHSGLWKVCILNKCDLFIHLDLYGV